MILNIFQRLLLILCTCLLLAACAAVPQVSVVPTTAPPTDAPTNTSVPTGTPTATVLPTPTWTSTPSVTPTPTATPIPLTPTATLAPLSEEERLAIFDRVWTLVRDRYVYPDYHGLDWQVVHDEFRPRVEMATTSDAFYNIMYELIDKLDDQHSRFDSPQDVAAEAASFEGDLVYVGIGAMVRKVDNGGMITRLAQGGPAEQAGLHPSDLVLKINGVPFTDTARFGAGGPISAVRGPSGTTVTLTIQSPDGTQRDVEVTRRPIPSDAFPPVEAERLPNSNVGYLAINTFDLDHVDQVVRQHLETLLQSGPLDGLIIDVRTNGGGRVDLMLNTIGLFANGGTIGSTQGRDRSYTLTAPEGQTLSQLAGVPIVVLTSEDTVSAAEMFAAGMQVLHRATIVGTHTAGNTENLSPHNLSDGSRLWLAELAFHLPDGTLIEGRGVLPDQTVEAEWWHFPLATDPQVQAALAALRATRLS